MSAPNLIIKDTDGKEISMILEPAQLERVAWKYLGLKSGKGGGRKGSKGSKRQTEPNVTIDYPTPPWKETYAWVKSLPNMRHTVRDAQLYFYKTDFKSTGTWKKAYVRLANQLNAVREEIGGFTSSVDDNGVKTYFQKPETQAKLAQ